MSLIIIQLTNRIFQILHSWGCINPSSIQIAMAKQSSYLIQTYPTVNQRFSKRMAQCMRSYIIEI